MSETTVGDDLDLVELVAKLRVGGTKDRPFRHQAIVLLWALGRTSRRQPRLVRWSAARDELEELLTRFGLPENDPTPQFPFVALHKSPLWDLAGHRTPVPPAHSSGALAWLNSNNPRGGLAMNVHLRVVEDAGERERMVGALLDRFFAGLPTDDLLAAVRMARPTTRLNWTWDELVLACDLLAQNDWHELPETDPRVIELSNVLQLLPIHPVELRSPRFRSTGSVRRKMTDIATQHEDSVRQRTNGNKLDKEVLAAFVARPEEMHLRAEQLRAGADTGEFERLPEVDTDGVPEGRLLERRHYVWERNPKLRAQKIDKALELHGRVACETCGFDFERTYGSRGARYAECHHAVPLHASGETKTTLADLVVLCANCHRMIHRRDPWLTPDELTALIESRQVTGS
jgi:5-methylcytosine-specific restriction protein A